MKKIKENFGIDLDSDVRSFTSKDREYLIQLVKDYKVLRFKNQHLTTDELIGFSEIFGECWSNDNPSMLGGNGESTKQVGNSKVTRVSNRSNGVLGDHEIDWHCDVSHKPWDSLGGTCPFRILYAHKLPSEKTLTRWLDREYAYTNTPEELHKICDQLYVLNQAPYKTTWTENIMPFVLIDPCSGNKSYALQSIFFKHFIGMTAADSKQLMNQLLEHATVPDNVMENVWEEGDLILNNNYNTAHRREKFHSAEERVLWRTTFQIPELIPLSIKPNAF
jgi:alpha-ketoglutarate-dependent taurine dioxygenase